MTVPKPLCELTKIHWHISSTEKMTRKFLRPGISKKKLKIFYAEGSRASFEFVMILSEYGSKYRKQAWCMENWAAVDEEGLQA